MSFQIDQRVVYPAFGLGRITGRVTKAFYESDLQEFYEVEGEHSTVWVQVNEAVARGLRAVTRKEELPTFRAVLAGAPAVMNADALQRHRDTSARLKRGTMQDLCEVVRDLTARGWRTPLSGDDLVGLTKSRHRLCQEWAAAAGVPLAQAVEEVEALLLAARQAFHGGPVGGP